MEQKQEELDVNRPLRSRAGSSARIRCNDALRLYGEYWNVEYGWVSVVWHRSAKLLGSAPGLENRAIDLVYEDPISEGQGPQPSEVVKK